MVNITDKSNTLRKAIASAIVRVSDPATVVAIKNRTVPKGDVFEFSRAAGLLAIKKTSDVIPDCHPLPIEFASIQHSIEGLEIWITVEVHTIYKTGVEVEAMHGASVTALTMYDMLKPIDKSIEIGSIKLVSKTGGKSSLKKEQHNSLRSAVVVCSDTIAAGHGTDESGKMIIAQLEKQGITNESYEVVPDDTTRIQAAVKGFTHAGVDVLIFVGGTGLGPRDNTPDAIQPLLEKEIPGIMEVARRYGQDRTPYAMLSRGVAGMIGKTLVLTLPGSKAGAVESLEAVLPHVLHVFRIVGGERH
ncbi:MAG: bifunctional molybdenum cofactor biosynthesis protein MoaC/MoaB [Chitinophagaceae bacterium]|nr:bifunctional molybdenum cofactor biosynthesis protein MoaC/MoaB [Chitinophagaceae bacterium]